MHKTFKQKIMVSMLIGFVSACLFDGGRAVVEACPEAFSNGQPAPALQMLVASL